ncbi:MAG: hypothetical protein ACJASX_000491 [Limisphaerales bacterium]|jgi:hypothetical protein
MKLKLDNFLLSGLLIAFFALSAFTIVSDIREHAVETPAKSLGLEWVGCESSGNCRDVSSS